MSKVLVVGLNYAPEPTGIAPYTAGLCRGLVARGIQVRVITSMPHYPEWRIRDDYPRWSLDEFLDGVAVHRIRHYVPATPSGIRRLISELSFGLRSLLARWGHPDVVIGVSPALFATALVMLKARIMGVPMVVWVQDLYSLGVVETANGNHPSLFRRLVAWVESIVFAHVQGVCVIHDRFRPVVERLGALPQHVLVIRNWAHLPLVSSEPIEETRERLGWGTREIVALHSGAIGRKQDLMNVVNAARIAGERGDPVRFVLMGNGSERHRLESAAQDIPCIDIVDPLPAEAYHAALRAADVLIVNEHAGLRDMAVPSKLTSYFSSGRPIIAATDAESVTAYEIESSRGGVRVDPGRPLALLEAIMELHRNGSKAASLARKGLEYRESKLSESFALDRYAAWLEGLTDGER